MVHEDGLLVTLVRLVDRIPVPTPPRTEVDKRRRGRPRVYSDRLFMKALLIMIVRHLHRVHELLAVLDEAPPPMPSLRALLTDEKGRYPSRRTWERRLRALPTTLPAQIGCFGRHLLSLIVPAICPSSGRAAALDSTVLAAKGGVWHKKHKEAGEVPHTSIDTEAGWTKSGWHGWVYGWKLHIAGLAVSEPCLWVPLAAELTPADVHDGQMAASLIGELPDQSLVRFLLGDRHYNTPEFREECSHRGLTLVSSRYGKYPHTDAGVEVRRIFHRLRSLAMENFNHHFKGVFDAHGQVPTRGKTNTARFALGAVFVYQLSLLYRFEHGLPLNLGLKHMLKAA